MKSRLMAVAFAAAALLSLNIGAVQAAPCSQDQMTSLSGPVFGATMAVGADVLGFGMGQGVSGASATGIGFAFAIPVMLVEAVISNERAKAAGCTQQAATEDEMRTDRMAAFGVDTSRAQYAAVPVDQGAERRAQLVAEWQIAKGLPVTAYASASRQ